MQFLFFLTFTVLALLNFILSEIVNLPLKVKTNSLTDSDYEALTLELCVGPLAQCYNVVFDTGSFYLWLPASYCGTPCMTKSNKYNPGFSYNFEYISENKTIPYLVDSLLEVDYGRDFVSVDMPMTLSNRKLIEFYLVTDMPKEVRADGVLGFGRRYNGKNSSIIDRLSIEDLGNKVFSFKYNDSKDGASLSLGGYTNSFKNKNFPKCSVSSVPDSNNDRLKNLWSCKLTYFVIGIPTVNLINQKDNQNVIHVNGAVSFDTGSHIIIAPMQYKDIIKTNYLVNGGCLTLESFDPISNYTIINCEKINIGALQQLNFVVNGYALSPDPTLLFKYKEDGTVNFQIQFSDKYDYWVLGLNFMKSYEMLFDYEQNIVGFSGQFTDLSAATTDSDFYIGNLMLLIIVLATIIVDSIIVLIIWCIYRNSKKSRDHSISVINRDNPYIRHLNKE